MDAAGTTLLASGTGRRQKDEREISNSAKRLGHMQIAFKIGALLGLLYLFVCSLDFLSQSFRLLGGRAAGKVFAQSELLRNPVVGLMIGVLVTVLVQSSSTSTSIAVTLVGSDLISVRNAVPIIMGANIGTSVTNTIVSLMQSSDREEFRRAFAAATVHDMFNWLTVMVLLPVEAATHCLEYLSGAMVKSTHLDHASANETHKKPMDFLNRLTKPFTKKVIQLDKKLIEKIAINSSAVPDDVSLIKRCCQMGKMNGTDHCVERCSFLFNQFEFSDSITGIVLLLLSLFSLCSCLILMVKVLHSMLKGQIAIVIKKTINADYDFPMSILVGYIAIFVGCIMTILVQSSSIFTSALTPLAGIGVISLERIYPLTLGANIGTTTTGLLAAIAAGSGSRDPRNAIQLAFCHLLFNLAGIALFYPIPFMRFPIPLAKWLGSTTARYRWFSFAYLFLMFFFVPCLVFTLSYMGGWVFVGVTGPLTLALFIISIVNLVQHKKPHWLPIKYRDWNWLPPWAHSLDPIDRQLMRLATRFSCLACCLPAQHERHDSYVLPIRSNPSQLHIFDAVNKLDNNDTDSDTESHDNPLYAQHYYTYPHMMNGLSKQGKSNKAATRENSAPDYTHTVTGPIMMKKAVPRNRYHTSPVPNGERSQSPDDNNTATKPLEAKNGNAFPQNNESQLTANNQNQIIVRITPSPPPIRPVNMMNASIMEGSLPPNITSAETLEPEPVKDNNATTVEMTKF